ncbi:response regulator [Candidatus Falkowbacteria bacterium]|uniref:Response regulator n=1 Tax=Candidatus Buchananbacteria bacterium CG10_big_fil_rev_8_21_14_0_10_33_19 TaxID=1974525 RepID=A0A2H0W4Q3_9BACT|nr:response regulator [Candidatus Falkowbacteria bacterium]PIS06329.1 MAG: response regulator [Candidatus Buchananbacteria bacterium CG10_big_fil_rev_8_21_14_0_10_33_19]
MTKKYKILLVEDEPDLADLFSISLKQAGFEVTVLNDGANTLSAVKKIKPDLVLLDLIIPKKDGYEVLGEIKADKVASKTMIYVFSNLTQKAEIDRAMKLGAKNYLIKSDYTPAKLAQKIKDILAIK